MSCDKRCSDPESEWHGHEDCDNCPGADKWAKSREELDRELSEADMPGGFWPD